MGFCPAEVAQFIVALDPVVEVEVLNTALSANAQLDTLRVGVFKFDTVPNVLGSIFASINARSDTDTTARITAKASGVPQAFIIAVQIEPTLRAEP